MKGLLLLLLLLLALVSVSGGADPVLVLPLLGNYSETFFWYTRIRIGGVNFTVTVDTGSSDLLVPALGCQSCFGGDPRDYYNVSGHELACPPPAPLQCLCSDAQCRYNVTYGGALTEYATAVQDEVTLGAGWTGQVRFGATYNVTQGMGGRRRRQAVSGYPEGIWGLAFSELNALGTTTLLQTLAAQPHVGRQDVFALCVEPVGGVLAVGGVPAAWPQPVWAPVIKKGFWQVGIADVTAAGESLGPQPIFNRPGIVDSGTPFFTLPAAAFERLYAVMLSMCSSAQGPLPGVCGVPRNQSLFGGLCFDLSAEEKARFPVLEVVLEGGGRLPVTPAMYLIPMYQCEPGQTGLAVVSDPTFTVVSGSLLLHYASIYDAEQLRVGFVPLLNRTCAQLSE